MDIGWKITNGILVAGAAVAANAILKTVWKGVTGNTPPKPGEEEAQSRLIEVLAFGALSGLVMAAMRRSAVLTANKWYGGDQFNKLEA